MRILISGPLALLGLACVSEHGPLTNRMAQSATPYLLRAARQPVSWQPWGRDAFALAARLERPVLLYVGAEDCRWCGVMDREVYGDPALGGMIDSLFVPVRVDREERPDIARRYETAVRLLAGLSGYPITVFLTPDGSAFFGGTYFPLDDPVTGRGLKQLLPEVARSYREQRASILERAALVERLSRHDAAAAHALPSPSRVTEETEAVRRAVADAATQHGGLASLRYAGPVGLLIASYVRTGDSSYLTPARRVLDQMIDSGEAVLAEGARDDPPELARAELLRTVTAAWAATGEPRYVDAARDLGRRLAGAGFLGERPIFADRAAYVIGSVLDAAAAMGDAALVARARAALDSLLKRVYARGRAVRHATETGAPVAALLEDQVQVAGACLAAYDATGAARYRAVAVDLVAVLERDFADSSAPGYFETPVAADQAAAALAERAKPVLDDLLPGPNAWAAAVLVRLARATGDERYRRRAEATLDAFADRVAGEGVHAATYLVVAQALLAER